MTKIDKALNEISYNREHLLPKIHVYCFTKNVVNMRAAAISKVEEKLMILLDDAYKTLTISHVRSVAPMKEMVRVSFRVPRQVLFRRGEEDGEEEDEHETSEPAAKKRNVEADLVAAVGEQGDGVSKT